VRDCPLKKLTEATGLTGKGKVPREQPGRTESELRDEWTKVEFQRMAKAYQPTGDMVAVTGYLGQLFYTTVKVGEVPVEAMVDTGSSATIMSFDTFQNLVKAAGIP
jgi:hypothetical protein